MRDSDKTFKRGDPIPADWLNAVAENVVKRISVIGGRFARSGSSLTLVFDAIRKAGGGSGELVPFRVDQVSGTSAPFVYSLTEVSPTSGGTFATVSGGRTTNAGYNTAETGLNPYHGKVPINTIVFAQPGYGSEWLFSLSNYRGTYP